MSIHAREYEHSLVSQAADRLYSAVIADLKPHLIGPEPNLGDAKRIVALAVSCGRDSHSFEKKGKLARSSELQSLSSSPLFAH